MKSLVWMEVSSCLVVQPSIQLEHAVGALNNKHLVRERLHILVQLEKTRGAKLYKNHWFHAAYKEYFKSTK